MKSRPNCPYCQRPLGNESVLAEVCTMTNSILSVHKHQYHRGRCVLSLKDHYEELYEVEPEIYLGFMEELKNVCQLISKLFLPDKIQVAFYGDTVRHVHAHIVPKYTQLEDWGLPFLMTSPADPDESWRETAKTLQEALNGLRRQDL